MILAFELAGYFAAHALWSVSEGSMLIPMLAYTTIDGQRKMERLVHDDLAAAVAIGQKRLRTNEIDMNVALQVFFDGVLAHEMGSKILDNFFDDSK